MSVLRGLSRLGQGVLLWLVVLPLLYPAVWLIVGALWPDNQPLSAWLLSDTPFRPTFANFPRVADTIPLARFFLSSVRVVVFALPLSLLVGSWAGFAIARLSPVNRGWLVGLSLAALLAPPTALWLARFPLFRLLGWLDTPLALIAPALIGGSPFFVLLLYNAYRRLSEEMLEAAALDGASLWLCWRLVALPNVAGTTGAVAILNFLYFWNNFTDPLLYVRSLGQLTLPVGVRLLAQMDESRWPLLLAGSLILALPPALAFLAGQRLLGDVGVTLR
ncbi:MAG: carbohydrate ABC transporter permease [Caldilineaceae bacterium]|nr:carbohydrate ABC transporter permease [Caldilineaceae bacterium]